MDQSTDGEAGGTCCYRVLSYYQYIAIPNPADVVAEQRAFCTLHDLRGRIWIAPEGVNGTLSGPVEATERYQSFVREQFGVKDLPFHREACEEHLFRKLIIRVKEEMVTWRLDLNPRQGKGHYLTPQEFRQALRDPDTLVLDGRNGYEYDLGHFRGAVRADVNTTREFPPWLASYLQKVPKEQPIVTYCTGGVRCEKLTTWLRAEGYQDVAQLQGGILGYAHNPETRGEGFVGRCYVFDQRISIPINQAEPHTIVGTCWHCQEPAERYINCGYDACHRQHLVCPSCDQAKQGYCTARCGAQAAALA